MNMEPNLKPIKKEPYILELSNLEKAICELGGLDQSSSSVDKLKLKDGKKDENLKYFNEMSYLNEDRSELSSDRSNSKLCNSNNEYYQSDAFSDVTISRKEEEKKELSEITTKTGVQNYLLNMAERAGENGVAPEKTGLDKLIPYHLFNCINPDILIRINDIEFGVHRPLLKLYTTFFEETVGDMDECVVNLPENKITMETFQAIYSWMLHEADEALNFIDRKNIANIHVASKFLKIKELINTCRVILESKDLFNEMTAFSLFMEAYHLNDKEIQMLMLPRIQSVFLHVVSSSLYVNLPVDIILMLLSSDHIKVHSELEVLYSGIKWLLHDWPSRSYNASRVMNTIRFALLRPSQLIDLKRCPDSPTIKMITNGKEILKLIDDGIALSVKLDTHSCSPELLRDECEKLGLQLPASRCWFEEPLTYQTYREFLQALDIIKRQHQYS